MNKPAKPSFLKSLIFQHETALFIIIVLEWLYFASAGRRFGTVENHYDILRHSVEIGLLALALTPVILMGGIDLSLGSLLGLCAILFGKLWRDAHFPIWASALITLGIGAIGGAINAGLIAGFRLPPLIVTLGTYSLFRGLAEAITHGVDTFTNFPAAFLRLGQEQFLRIPAQGFIFAVAALSIWFLVHRTTFGRSFRVIGFAPEGARFAGIPVERRIILAYVLAGVISALAALIYTARLGQAKADAGTGYELFAITAVVLGGTSIFGGIGSVHGTLLGVAAIGVLNNGLVHIRQPREVAGMLTGALLLAALSSSILIKRLSIWKAHRQNTSSFNSDTKTA